MNLIVKTKIISTNYHYRTCVKIFSKIVLFTGLLSIFLSIHPFGASFESIVSYIKLTNNNVTTQQIENVLVTNKILFEYCQFDNEKSFWKLVNFS